MSEDLLLTKTEAEIDILIDDPNEPPNNLNKEENFNDFVTPSSSLSSTVLGNNKMVIEHDYMLNQYVNDNDRWHIGMDHCYARPWNWRPDTTFLRPTKTLFIKKTQVNRRKSTNPLAPIQDFDEDIDVVTINEENTSVYDIVKAKAVMEECEKHVALAKVDDRVKKWEEEVLRNCPTTIHQRLLRGMLTILDNDRLARLASTDRHHEAIEKRVLIDKSVERVRKLMATISWESKYTQWLHQILIDNLTPDYLTSYLDILQTLKSKLPTFVDRMMSGTVSNRLLSYECLFPLLKRPWDPVASSLLQDKPKKLPGNPIILIVPSSPITSKRMVKWTNLLSNLTTVITLPTNLNSNSNNKTTMTNFVDQIFVMARSKLQDIRNDYPGRNIVLFGFNYGATLALQIAQVEQVLCVICLSFSLLTAEGRRGEPDDNILELQCPVLFVIGQRSSTSFQEDMEDLRERMRVETGLIIVGSADDNLRISKKLKRTEGITQSIVDRCITDEIGEFIGGIILSPYPPHIRQSPTDLTADNGKKPTKNERKRYSSNTSSLDSEPPSPTPRITRPGPNNSSFIGRPPGSKSKSKLDTKFIQGTTSSPSNTQSSLPPPPPPPSSSSSTTSTSINSTQQLSVSGDQNDNSDKTDVSSQPPPLKKIKTLKPTITRSLDKNSLSKGIGKSINFQSLSNLLQGDTIAKSSSGGIRVLENVKFTNATFVSSSPTTLPSSSSTSTIIKTSLLNTTKSTSGNQFILLPPDGKIKTLSPSTTITATTTTAAATTIKSPPPSGNSRYITSKRQLLGNEKVIKTIKKLPTSTTTNPTLATNLTTEDIMDLPIIFADDNHQILENNEQNQILTTEQQQETKSNIAIANKFVVINKSISLQNANNLIITTTTGSNNQKKIATISSPTIVQQSQVKMPPKYKKIILSTKQSIDDTKITEVEQEKCNNLSEKNQIEGLDLEKEIAASTVYKTGDIKINIDEDCQLNKKIKLN